MNATRGHWYLLPQFIEEKWPGWLAAHDRAVAQQALRDAARDFPGFDPIRTHGDAKSWLRDRAVLLGTRP